jgi:hypothetical protein
VYMQSNDIRTAWDGGLCRVLRRRETAVHDWHGEAEAGAEMSVNQLNGSAGVC